MEIINCSFYNWEAMKEYIKKYSIYAAWATALIATAGSLYFSEISHFPPCVLCWYQRIFMYPLVIIIAVGILEKNKNVYRYVLPMTAIGWTISVFHNLLYYKIIPESAAPCYTGVSCTTKFIEWFGFITIPFLSFIAFTIVALLMVAYWKLNQTKTKTKK